MAELIDGDGSATRVLKGCLDGAFSTQRELLYPDIDWRDSGLAPNRQFTLLARYHCSGHLGILRR